MKGHGRGGVSSSGCRGWGFEAYANRVSVPNLGAVEQANHVVADQDHDGLNGLTKDQWHTIKKKILNVGEEVSIEKLTG